MFGDVLIFTAAFVFGVLSGAVLIVWWFVTEAYGQHTGAGEEAVSVGFLEEKINAEIQTLVETTRPISPEKPFPQPLLPLRKPPVSVWTLPELVAA